MANRGAAVANNTLPQWADMQGLVVSSYPGLHAAEYIPLKIDDPDETKKWLKRIAADVTTAAQRGSDTTDDYIGRLNLKIRLNVNIALSYTGLVKLCDRAWSDQESRSSFLCAFREGIAGNVHYPDRNVHRLRILGDTEDNDPDRWHWGGQENPVDVLLIVFAENEAKRRTAVAQALNQSGMARVLGKEALAALCLNEAADKEHFGFLDGRSQPILHGTADAERFPDSIHLTALGEFVFGYPDGEHSIVEGPTLKGCEAFGRNGTYLVFRQLEQHVATFWNAMYEKTSSGVEDPVAAEHLAAKIVGRQQDGTPLVPYGQVADNEFDFTDDTHGYGCPVSAHIRRANPRKSLSPASLPLEQLNRHRLLRRSRLYGSKVEPVHRRYIDPYRGLLFLALNSDFERQFEFINQNWINGSGFSGLQGEYDPLVGRDPSRRFTIPGLPARTRVDGLPHFITVKGGEYFFLPGIHALRHLGGP